jgi:DnaJ-class molecular chaperone
VLQRIPAATIAKKPGEEIKRAMRKLALKYYGKDDAMFAQVIQTYHETLSDPFLKEIYDRGGQ